MFIQGDQGRVANLMGISQRSSNHRRKAHLINVVSALVLVGLVCLDFDAAANCHSILL